jgi:hypothetical protein
MIFNLKLFINNLIRIINKFKIKMQIDEDKSEIKVQSYVWKTSL